MPKILVVDDDEQFLRFVKETLLCLEYDVMTANTSDKGVALFSSFEPDVVLSDLFMPNTDGIQFLIEITDENPDAKIVLMSGGGNTMTHDLLQSSKLLGAVDTITKPFDIDQLEAKLNSVLRQ